MHKQVPGAGVAVGLGPGHAEAGGCWEPGLVVGAWSWDLELGGGSQSRQWGLQGEGSHRRVCSGSAGVPGMGAACYGEPEGVLNEAAVLVPPSASPKAPGTCSPELVGGTGHTAGPVALFQGSRPGN